MKRPAIDASLVIDRLAVGGKPAHNAPFSREGWDALVLCAREHQPMTHVRRRIPCPLNDSAYELMYPESIRLVTSVVREVVELHRRGARILVTCIEGRNRSALVAALAVKELLGVTGAEAVERVRAGRNPALWAKGHRDGANHVLVNTAFEEYVTGTRREDPDAPFAFLRSVGRR